MPEISEYQSEMAYNKNEKKCRKALIKSGMKLVPDINRITLKKRDGLLFEIDRPEVF